MTLWNDGIYVMLELANITAPDSIANVSKYLTDFNKVLLVLEVFDNWCHPLAAEKIQQQKQRSRSSLSTPVFNRIVSSTTSRNRASMFKQY